MKGEEMEIRKVIQLAVAVYQGVALVALCDDGTMWWNERPYDPTGKIEACNWRQIKEIPQDEAQE